MQMKPNEFAKRQIPLIGVIKRETFASNAKVMLINEKYFNDFVVNLVVASFLLRYSLMNILETMNVLMRNITVNGIHSAGGTTSRWLLLPIIYCLSGLDLVNLIALFALEGLSMLGGYDYSDTW